MGLRRMVHLSVREVLQKFRDVMFQDRIARREGLLQSIDPRAKIVVIVALIFTAVFLKKIVTLVAILFLAVLLAMLSKISLRFFLLRTFVFIPLFSAVIAIPLPFIVGGETITSIALGGILIRVSREGLLQMVQFILRVWVCVSLSVLLVLTTTWPKLMHALARMRVPRVFVLIADMTYRYLFYFADMLYKMLLARESRLTGPIGMMDTMKTGASAVGALLVRAYEHGERVYLAMKSRGFCGSIEILDNLTLRPRDITFMMLLILSIIPLILVEVHALPLPSHLLI
ncbi:MAG: cobalt ECF transporter T component CbiQ [Candidatus Baldrarchaeia archaeon]